MTQDVAGFTITLTLIEPSAYYSNGDTNSAQYPTGPPACDAAVEQSAHRPSRRGTAGNPVATRDAITALVGSDNPSRRVFLGPPPLAIATADAEPRLATCYQLSPCP